jgi:uncharacterized protein (DUF2252 family)
MDTLAPDLRLKHESMREDAFTFFRATFYRWTQLWQGLPATITRAPTVLGVGDAHVENFGTWRDREGRLVWGVNDFDEAAILPYTNDLLRLVVSGLLAREAGTVRTAADTMLDALLLGYSAGLVHGGSPFVIEERNPWLRKLAQNSLRTPERYWTKLIALDRWHGTVPARAAELLNDVPRDAKLIKIVHRISGAGSLGRPRLAALYDWRGGYIAREVKARAPSAWLWATAAPLPAPKATLPAVWKHAVRCHDPSLKATRRWIVRRLAPDCSRIDLSDLPKKRQEIALFRAMGWEVANVHCGSNNVNAVRKHLEALDRRSVSDSSEFLRSHIRTEFRQWRRGR